MTTESCSNCYYSTAFTEADLTAHQCRFMAPSGGGTAFQMFNWPIVRDVDWCSNWRAQSDGAVKTIASGYSRGSMG